MNNRYILLLYCFKNVLYIHSPYEISVSFCKNVYSFIDAIGKYIFYLLQYGRCTSSINELK